MTLLRTYALEIHAPDETPAEEGSAFGLEQAERRVLSNLPAILEDVEENLTDVLPEGFRAQIGEIHVEG